MLYSSITSLCETQLPPQVGVLSILAGKQKPIKVVKGKTTIHPKYIQCTNLQFTLLIHPSHKATPTVEPTIPWVVEIGMSRRAATTTLIIFPSSIEKLREGL